MNSKIKKVLVVTLKCISFFIFISSISFIILYQLINMKYLATR